MEPVTTTSVLTISYSKLILNGLLAILGGIVRILAKKDKNGNVVRPTLWNFLGSIVCAGFTGMIVFFVCENYHLSAEMTAALTSISGYLGPVVIDVSFAKLQKYVDKKISNLD